RGASRGPLGPPSVWAGKVASDSELTVRTMDGTGYGKSVEARVAGASIASKKGALAIVIRSIGTGQSRFPHTGSLHYEDGAPPIPAAALSTDDADLLTRTLALHPHTQLKLSLETRSLGPVTTSN